MRGYEWGTGSVRCGFCNAYGHNITSCPEVNKTVTSVLKKMQNDPNYVPMWGESKALREMKRREERRAKQKTTPRKKPRCSFCGSRTHKRNKCTKLKKFESRLHRANHKWRAAFVSHMNVNGFGIGSLVSIPKGLVGHWAEEGKTTGIIVGYDREKLNLFCTLNDAGEYYSEPSIEVLCEGKVVNIPVNRLVGIFDEEIVGKMHVWNHYKIESLGKSQAEVSEEFYKSDGDAPLKWFLGKVSTKQKVWFRIDKLVRRWLR